MRGCEGWRTAIVGGAGSVPIRNDATVQGGQNDVAWAKSEDGFDVIVDTITVLSDK